MNAVRFAELDEWFSVKERTKIKDFIEIKV